jgi:hypothetical protein
LADPWLPLPALFPGLLDLDDHAIIADGLQVSQLDTIHVDAADRGARGLEPASSAALGTSKSHANVKSDQLMDLVAPMPYPAVNTMLDGGFPRGALNYWRSAFFT